MPPALGRSPEAVVAAVRSGEPEESELDDRVARVLRLVSKGMDVLEAEETFDVDAHHDLARAAAAESVVLLVNDGVLPLAPSARVAIVGELARTPRFQGAGSSQVNPTRVDSFLGAARQSLGAVSFAAGYTLEDSAPADAGLDTRSLLEEARAVVRDAELVVLMIGLPSSYESEGFDRTHLKLPPDQIDALRAVAEEAHPLAHRSSWCS